MARHVDGREIVRLAPAGIAAIETAQANGSWTALDAVERLEEPPELAAALDADPAARGLRALIDPE